MTRTRPPSPQTIEVMNAMSIEPSSWRYGYDLCQQTGLKAGSMYPILIRLTERGWLETKWEAEHIPGRPPRHLYRLTGEGLKQVKAFADVSKKTRHSLAALRPREGTA